MNSAMAGYIGAAIGVPLVFWMLRKSFRSLSVYETSNRSLDDLAKEFSKWNNFGVICFMLLSIATGYLWWVFFSKIGQLYATRFKDAIICVSTTGVAWALPSMTAGMVSGNLLADKLLKFMLKGRVSEFVVYQNMKNKINTEKLEVPMLTFLAVVTFVMFLMGLNWYTLFTSDEMVIRGPLSVSGNIFAYSDVSSIETAPFLLAPNGNSVRRREYLVKFFNGRHWTTNNEPTDLSEKQKTEIARLVSEKSGVPITEKKILAY